MLEYKFEIKPFDGYRQIEVTMMSGDGAIIFGRRYLGFLWFLPMFRLDRLTKSMIKDAKKAPARRAGVNRLEKYLNDKTGS